MAELVFSIVFGIAAEEGQKLDISAKVGAGEDAKVALFTYLTRKIIRYRKYHKCIVYLLT